MNERHRLMKTIDEMTDAEFFEATLRGMEEVVRQFERRDATKLKDSDEASRDVRSSSRGPADS